MEQQRSTSTQGTVSRGKPPFIMKEGALFIVEGTLYRCTGSKPRKRYVIKAVDKNRAKKMLREGSGE